jgi:murein DD-endopeptidase MepM/ murein hydrolase activator NlpD
MHHAIDYYVGHGSAIYAANNGTVLTVGSGCIRGDTKCNGTKGNFIVIDHNIKYKNYPGDLHSQYLHLDKIYVEPGQTVYRGQKIGTMGNTGFVVPTPGYGSKSLAGTHLHFEIWSGLPYAGIHHNPLKFY